MGTSNGGSNDSYLIVIIVLALVICLILPLSAWIYLDDQKIKHQNERRISELEKSVKRLEEK